MPQLDRVTFFSQFLWCSVFFFGFYFVICKHFLPKMSRILKFRKRKMNLGEGVQSMQQENEKVRASSKTLVEKGLNTSSSFLLAQLQRMDSWLSAVISHTNQQELQRTNHLYVKWVGDNSTRQESALQGILLPFSPQVFAFLLAEKCRHRESKQISKGAFSSRPDSLDQPLVQKTRRIPNSKKSQKK